MRREVLYYVAISAPVGAQTQAVQRAYHLNGLIPTAEVLSADVLRTQPLLREAREQLASAKDLWLKITGGRPENIAQAQADDGRSCRPRARHRRALAVPPDRRARQPRRQVRHGCRFRGGGDGIRDGLAARRIDDRAFRLDLAGAAASDRRDAGAYRRRAAEQADAGHDRGAPLLDEMARRAQERLLLAQVAREIQANLRHMEQVLDAFFRDNSKRADLATLANDSRQIAGALKMLGLDTRRAAARALPEADRRVCEPGCRGSQTTIWRCWPNRLSGLGFYIEAVEQQRPDRDRLIAPLLDRRLGVAPSAPAAEPETVESAVVDLRCGAAGNLCRLSERARRPGGAGQAIGRSDDAEARRRTDRRCAPAAGRRCGADRARACRDGRHRGAAGCGRSGRGAERGRARSFRGNDAPAGNRRDAVRYRVARHLSDRSRRSAGYDRGQRDGARREFRRSHSIVSRAARIPHA